MTVQTGPQYIAHCRSLGFNDVEITTAMQKVGWEDADIQAAFAQAASIHTTTKPGKKKSSNTVLWIIIAVVVIIFIGSISVAAFFAFT